MRKPLKRVAGNDLLLGVSFLLLQMRKHPLHVLDGGGHCPIFRKLRGDMPPYNLIR